MIKWPDSVVQTIARRRAVVLLGSGVSANAQAPDGSRPPTWGDFLKAAYAELNAKPKFISSALKRYQYLEACEYIKGECGNAWPDLIRKHFVHPQFKAAAIHKAIFELDVRIVVSLNFDKIYEGYAIPASENSIIIKHYYDDDIRQVAAGTERYVLKPHGTTDTISKMIFAADEYAKARTKHASFYELFTALLHTHVFLCVGCGLSDPDMKLLFEDYKYKHDSESPHFITLPNPVTAPEAKLIEKTRGMKVLAYSTRDHHHELSESLVELGKKAQSVRDIIAREQDW